MIRRALEGDAEAIAGVFRWARTVCLPYLPELHTPASELAFFRDHVLRHAEVWVAATPDIDGFCAFRDGWVEHLYVRPDRHAQGIGSALLDEAKRTGSTLRLRVFQRNTDAVRFYQRRGFQIIEASDGDANEEHEPDFCMQWPATTP